MTEKNDQPKKLFVVTMTSETVVVATSLADACERAMAIDRIDLPDVDIDADEMRYLPAGDQLDSIPFGYYDPVDPDRTIEGWIKEGAGEAYLTGQRHAVAAHDARAATEPAPENE